MNDCAYFYVIDGSMSKNAYFAYDVVTKLTYCSQNIHVPLQHLQYGQAYMFEVKRFLLEHRLYSFPTSLYIRQSNASLVDLLELIFQLLLQTVVVLVSLLLKMYLYKHIMGFAANCCGDNIALPSLHRSFERMLVGFADYLQFAIVESMFITK